MNKTVKIIIGVVIFIATMCIVAFWLAPAITDKAEATVVAVKKQADSLEMIRLSELASANEEDANRAWSEKEALQAKLDSLMTPDTVVATIDTTTLPAPAPVVAPTQPTAPRAVLVSGKTTTLPYPKKGAFVVDSVNQKIIMLASDKGKLTVSKDYDGWSIITKPR